MKHLFEDDKYTDEGIGINHSATLLLRHFIKDLIEDTEGYSLREIAYILHQSVEDVTLNAIIDKKFKIENGDYLVKE
jgi:hypothetical protein